MDTATDLEAPFWMPEMEARTFLANGNEYFIAKSMTVDYMEHFERKENEFGFGSSFKAISAALVQMIGHMNKREDISAGVIARDLLKGIANLEERHTSAMELCTLFMLRKGEDTSKYDEAVAEAKIADWKAARIDAQFFFQHAAISVSGFISAFKLHSQTDTPSLQPKGRKKKKLKIQKA